MYSFRKSKKGFTLVELMVVVAIIGILALLGLRLFLMQQIRAKNAICKANAATVHTIIQGNLADMSYVTALLAVNDVRMANGITLLDNGDGTNTDNPAGMKNPHLTAGTDFVVKSIDVDEVTTAEFIVSAELLGATLYSGAIIVGSTDIANKFYIVPLDNLGIALGEVYVAQK